MERRTIGGTEDGCPSGEREFLVGEQSGGTQSLGGEARHWVLTGSGSEYLVLGGVPWVVGCLLGL